MSGLPGYRSPIARLLYRLSWAFENRARKSKGGAQ